jgi:hypothetical protein
MKHYSKKKLMLKTYIYTYIMTTATFVHFPNIIRMTKSRSMKGVRHRAYMGEIRNVYKILVQKPEGKDHLEDLGTDGSLILKWTLGKMLERVEWIHLVQNKDWWKALVNTVIGAIRTAPWRHLATRDR